MRIVIASAITLFERGPVDAAADLLASALERHGHATERLRLPYRAEPIERIPAQALAASELGLEPGGLGVDLLIALSFPANLVRHPRKVIWPVAPLDTARPAGSDDLAREVARIVEGANADSLRQARLVPAPSVPPATDPAAWDAIVAELLA